MIDSRGTPRPSGAQPQLQPLHTALSDDGAFSPGLAPPHRKGNSSARPRAPLAQARLASHRRDRFRRPRPQCAHAAHALGTLMRHLFSNGELERSDAAGTPPGARRACVDHGASADNAGPRPAATPREPVSSTAQSSSTDRGHKAYRSPPACYRAGSRRADPPESSSRPEKDWTSFPLSGDTYHLRHHAAGGKAQGDGQVFCPWAFGLPGRLVLSHLSAKTSAQPPVSNDRGQTIGGGAIAATPGEVPAETTGGQIW